MASSIGALYVEHQRAIWAIDRLLDDGCPLESVSLLMSDRALQRAFSLRSRRTSDLPVPLSPALRKLASELKPLAPLGAPGGGTVGVGPVIAPLERAGLGSAHGIKQAVLRCGAEEEVASVISRAIPNNAVLVFVQAEDANVAAQARHCFADASAIFELEGNHDPLPQGGIWLPTPQPAFSGTAESVR